MHQTRRYKLGRGYDRGHGFGYKVCNPYRDRRIGPDDRFYDRFIYKSDPSRGTRRDPYRNVYREFYRDNYHGACRGPYYKNNYSYNRENYTYCGNYICLENRIWCENFRAYKNRFFRFYFFFRESCAFKKQRLNSVCVPQL